MIAHRAGNTIDALRRAESLGVDLVEADVRLYRGRAVLRHLKTVGPLPLYWDRWSVASPFSRHLRLDELVAAAAEETEILLDLKGPRRRLAELVLERLRPHLGRRQFTVCARWWGLLDPFEGFPVRRVASVGSSRQLRALVRRHAGRRFDAVAIHERLLADEAAVADIRRVADLVFTWPVNTPARARTMLELRVDGLISDHADRIASVAAAARA